MPTCTITVIEISLRDPNLDAVGAGEDELFDHLARDDVAGDDEVGRVLGAHLRERITVRLR